jgi:hypothetical protein
MSRVMPVACVVVGLGMAAGFGAISVDSLLDYRAFPAAPKPVSVAQLAAMTSAPRGTWVRLVDPQPDCSRGYATPYDTPYALVGDGKTHAVAIVSIDHPPPCQDLARIELTGVPAVYRTVDGTAGTALPDKLAWTGVDWGKWPANRAVILWTRSGPNNSRTGIWVGAGFALLGLGVFWYGVRWLKLRVGDAVAVDPNKFPSTVQLASRGATTLPAAVVWLPVLRVDEVRSRGIATDVTLYLLQSPPPVTPLATRGSRPLSVHTGPGKAGLIFRTPAREAVAAARPAGSDDYVIIRSDLAELALDEKGREALRMGQLRF